MIVRQPRQTGIDLDYVVEAVNAAGPAVGRAMRGTLAEAMPDICWTINDRKELRATAPPDYGLEWVGACAAKITNEDLDSAEIEEIILDYASGRH